MSEIIDLGAVSAYAIAVENGFEGTESEWLTSLKGENGNNGTTPNITIDATIDNTCSDTPTVEITKTGTDTEPMFNFAFKGLKGANGSSSDIDDTVISQAVSDYLDTNGVDMTDYLKKENLYSYAIDEQVISNATVEKHLGSSTATSVSDGTFNVTHVDGSYSGPYYTLSADATTTNTVVFELTNVDLGSATSITFSLYISINSKLKALTSFKVSSTSQTITQTFDASYFSDNNITDTLTFCISTNVGCSYTSHVTNTYGTDLSVQTIHEDVEELKSPLYGKKVMFLGDSITSFEDSDYSWVDKFVAITGCTKVVNVAVASAVLKDSSDTTLDGNPVSSNATNNTLSNQVQKIVNNAYTSPDVIIIAIGTNSGITADSSNIIASYVSGGSLVALSDIDRTTNEGAFRYCNETLRNLYPDAIICWCNPIQRCYNGQATPMNVTVSGWADALKTLTSIGGVNNIETNRCGIIMANEVSGANGECLRDGLHPNAYGAEKMARYNAKAIGNLILTC